MNSPTLLQYVENLFGGEDPLLASMRQEAEAQDIPTIQVPFALGRTLQTLVLASGARRALEIGTLFGYSGILIARALPDDGKLITLEASAKHAAVARANFQRAGVDRKIELHEGPALELLPTLPAEPFDLVFIDADKVSYPQYLDWALKLTHPGSLIVADNVWRDGQVAQPSNPDADGAARFNKQMASDPRLMSVILPRLNPTDAFSLSVVR
jgi:caffeoyl-CoA O-methyltransferase